MSLVLATVLAAASPGAAATPSDFAWQWRVDAPASSDGVHRISIDEPVYRRLARADLLDLVAFDARGHEVPFGPVPFVGDPAVSTKPGSFVYAVNWYPVPRAGVDDVADGSVDLRIERDAAGRLRAIDTHVQGTTIDDARRADHDVLIDLGKPTHDVDAIDVSLDLPADTPFRATVDVLVSNDLRRFHLLDAEHTLLVLHQDGRRLERLRLALPATRGPYLLLRRTDRNDALPVKAITAQLRPPPVDTRALLLRGVTAMSVDAAGTVPGEFRYDAGGPFPSERVAVTLAGGNAVADVTIESRASDDAPWRPHARVLAFRVAVGGEETANLPIAIGTTRDRQWRLLTSPPQPSAPTLDLSYRADQFVVMTQGEGPHTIAAGSARATRASFPLQAMLDQLRARGDRDWQPPPATLLAGTATVAGADALTPPRPPVPWRRWLLWGVLIVGSLIVVLMVMRLLRASDASPPP